MLFLLLLLNVATSICEAHLVTIAWNLQPEADGFNVYWGAESGNLVNSADCGAAGPDAQGRHRCTLDVSYNTYIAITAYIIVYDPQLGQITIESEMTPEIFYTTPSGLIGSQLASLVVNCSPGGSSGTAQVTLGWDANIEPDLAGYKIYYGTSSGNYTNSIDVGNVTQYTIYNLQVNVMYYFAATAYDDANNESSYSEELAHMIILQEQTQVIRENPPLIQGDQTYFVK